jgi:hypothetical protein
VLIQTCSPCTSLRKDGYCSHSSMQKRSSFLKQIFNTQNTVSTNFADLECLSGILIFIQPRSRTQQHQQKRRNKICFPTFTVAKSIIKLKVILFLNYSTFYQKNCHKALKNIGLGSRGQKGTESRNRNTGKYFTDLKDKPKSYGRL